MVIRELITLLSLKQNSNEFKQAMESADRLKARLDKVSGQFTAVGGKMTLAFTAPFLAFSGLAVKSVADFEETQSKFQQVFSSIKDEANITADNLVKSFGLSKKAALDLLSGTGDILSGFGFTQEKSLELSNTIQQLAVDITSFKNIEGGAERASSALTKALLGEREALKGLGIAILEEDVKLKIQEMRMKGVTFQSERQAKAMATLALIQERSANAIGDFARTSDSFTNRSRVFAARIEDLRVKFGKLLLPAASAVLGVLEKMATWLNNAPDRVRKMILVIGGLLAVIGPLLLALGFFIKSGGLLIAAIQGLSSVVAAFGAVSWSAMLPWLAWGALIAFVILLIEDLWAALEGGDSVLGSIYNYLTEQSSVWMSLIDGVFKYLTIIQDLFNIMIKLATLDLSGLKNVVLNDLIPDLDSVFGGKISALQNMFSPTSAPLPASASGAQAGANLQQANQIAVTVDAREMSPTEATQAVRTGVESGLLDALKKSQQQLKPGVEF